MCACVQSSVIIAYEYGGIRSRKFGLARCSWNCKPPLLVSGMIMGCRELPVTKLQPNGTYMKHVTTFNREKLFMNQRVPIIVGVVGSNGFDFNSELRLKEGGDEHFELGLHNGQEKLKELEFISENAAADNMRTHNSLKKEKHQNFEFGQLNFDDPLKKENEDGVLENDNLMSIENGKIDDFKLEDQVEELLQPKANPKMKPKLKGKLESRSRNQLIKRSSVLAKQVIGLQSALSLGFTTQLCVDTTTWAVLEIEVRPNLLSSESGKFLLEDIKKVGDVVLVQDESYILNEFRTVGLETLVGYSVLTTGHRNLGKVRDYTFDINSGTVESLELDAFGYSIIPSSLVTTYALFTEDVLEVVSDTIIVHEAAASRIQRLTKGFWGTKNTQSSSINVKHHDPGEESTPPVKGRKSKRKFSKRKFYPRMRDFDDDLELPVDYM